MSIDNLKDVVLLVTLVAVFVNAAWKLSDRINSNKKIQPSNGKCGDHQTMVTTITEMSVNYRNLNKLLGDTETRIIVRLDKLEDELWARLRNLEGCVARHDQSLYAKKRT